MDDYQRRRLGNLIQRYRRVMAALKENPPMLAKDVIDPEGWNLCLDTILMMQEKGTYQGERVGVVNLLIEDSKYLKPGDLVLYRPNNKDFYTVEIPRITHTITVENVEGYRITEILPSKE